MRGVNIAVCLPLLACASSPPSTEVAAASSTAEIEIAPVQPSPPSTTSATVLATAAPPDPMSFCDQYWIRMRGCMQHSLKTVDANVLETAMKALDDAERQTREAMAELDFAARDAACTAMIDALAQNPTCPKD